MHDPDVDHCHTTASIRLCNPQNQSTAKHGTQQFPLSNKSEYHDHTHIQSRCCIPALQSGPPPCNKIDHHNQKWPFLRFLLLTHVQSQQLLHFDTDTWRGWDLPHGSVPCCSDLLGLFPTSPPSHCGIPCTLSTSFFVFIYLVVFGLFFVFAFFEEFCGVYKPKNPK